jgi:hypothetical protein
MSNDALTIAAKRRQKELADSFENPGNSMDSRARHCDEDTRVPSRVFRL